MKRESNEQNRLVSSRFIIISMKPSPSKAVIVERFLQQGVEDEDELEDEVGLGQVCEES